MTTLLASSRTCTPTLAPWTLDVRRSRRGAPATCRRSPAYTASGSSVLAVSEEAVGGPATSMPVQM